jgi:hypothetical protein
MIFVAFLQKYVYMIFAWNSEFLQKWKFKYVFSNAIFHEIKMFIILTPFPNYLKSEFYFDDKKFWNSQK